MQKKSDFIPFTHVNAANLTDTDNAENTYTKKDIDNAFNSGVAAGREEILREKQLKKSELLQLIESLYIEFQQFHATHIFQLSESIRDMIILIVEKILSVKLDINPELLSSKILDIIKSNHLDDIKFTLQINPVDKLQLDALEFEKICPNISYIEDENLIRGGFKISHNHVNIDSSCEVKFEQIFSS